MHEYKLPSIDQSISGWLDQQNREQQQDTNSKFRFSLTLSRQFGCEAYPMAVALKEALEKEDEGQSWTIFDRNLIDKILEETQISRRVLENFGSKSVFYDSLMSSLVPKWTSDADIYELMVKTIISAAQEGRAIFVGRGAAVVTQEMPRCFHFRLSGEREYRIGSLMRRRKLSREEVLSMMKEREAERERFISRFLGSDTAAIDNYHMVLNTEKSSIDQMAQTILRHVKVHMDGLP